MIRLVVGLGNPGKKYARTRHNAGFWWLERLAADLNAELRDSVRFHGRYAKIATSSGELWLLEPQTYMNESGRAVAALAHFHKIVPEEILVAHDELDLPPGTARLKLGGGVAGHNGLKDIAARLGSRDFWRLRIGIGHPGDRAVVADYVLHHPRAEEAALLREAIAKALDCWPLLAAGDAQAAMHRLHTKP